MKSRVPFAILLLLFGACATTPQRARPGSFGAAPLASAPERVTAPSVPSLEGIPQAVRVGLTVYVSGMVPVDSAGRMVGGDDLEAQVRQTVTNLNAVVRAARGLPGDVVKVTLYLKDPSPAAIATARAALLHGLDPRSPPALTVVGVASLPELGMRVMLDATAQLRSEFPDRARMVEGDRPQ